MDNPVPLFARPLRSLSACLEKAEAHCAERKIDPAVLFAARLFPDMLPLGRQVMIATDHAKGMAARLTGGDNPAFPDVETSLTELRERLARCLAFIEGVDPAGFADAGARPVTVSTRRGDLAFTGATYLAGWAVPNFFFHVTTAYNILRHNGVPLGKADFLGG